MSCKGGDKQVPDDKPEIEVYILERTPRYEFEVVRPGTRPHEILVDARQALILGRDFGYAVFAGMVNNRILVSEDGKKPPTRMSVTKINASEEFTIAYNFDVMTKLSHAACVELMKMQMMRIPFGHFSNRTASLISAFGRETVERASQIIMSQLVNTALLAEEGVVLPLPEMFEFERNLTLQDYCELLIGAGMGGSPTAGIKFSDTVSGKLIAIGGKVSDPELQELLDKMQDADGFTKLDTLEETQHGDMDRMESSAKDLINQVKGHLESNYNTDLKQQGWMAGSGEEFIKALFRQPKLEWTMPLRGMHGRHMSRKRRISPRRPSRRGEYPYKGRVHLREVSCLWWIDTSGSMGSRELRWISSELRGMKAKGCTIWVGMIDAGIAMEPMLYNGFQEIEQFFGRGGTDFRPGFDYAHDMRPRPDFLVYFTDGMGSAPSEPSEIDTLWILTSSGYTPEQFKSEVCSWGEVTKFDVDEEEGAAA